MRTHRGINMSSVAGEGLQDLPGLLIAVFFVMAGSYLVRIWFVPVGPGGVDAWLVVVWILLAPAACVGFLIGQRRDKQLRARIQEELHKLNETGALGESIRPLADAGDEALKAWHGELGLAEFKAEELRRAARPSAVSPEALLIVVLGLVFIAGMLDMFITLEHYETLENYKYYEEELFAGFVAIVFGGGIGYVLHRIRVRREARRVARELDEPG